MGNATNVEFIAHSEPWRGGQGRPRNPIDPLWAGDTLTLCEATTSDIEWEVGKNWWWCRLCGHCSSLHFLSHHVVERPSVYFVLSKDQFMRRRATQGFPMEEAADQARHIMGIALRVAASRPPEQFSALVESILRLAD